MQYVQTGKYSQVDKTVLQAKMGSTACSTQYGSVYAHNLRFIIVSTDPELNIL
jgi:hypothetical protein